VGRDLSVPLALYARSVRAAHTTRLPPRALLRALRPSLPGGRVAWVILFYGRRRTLYRHLPLYRAGHAARFAWADVRRASASTYLPSSLPVTRTRFCLARWALEGYCRLPPAAAACRLATGVRTARFTPVLYLAYLACNDLYLPISAPLLPCVRLYKVRMARGMLRCGGTFRAAAMAFRSAGLVLGLEERLFILRRRRVPAGASTPISIPHGYCSPRLLSSLWALGIMNRSHVALAVSPCWAVPFYHATTLPGNAVACPSAYSLPSWRSSHLCLFFATVLTHANMPAAFPAAFSALANTAAAALAAGLGQSLPGSAAACVPPL